MAVSGRFELITLYTKCVPFLAPLDKGSKIEELVRNIRTRKGLKVDTILGPFSLQLLTFWFV